MSSKESCVENLEDSDPAHLAVTAKVRRLSGTSDTGIYPPNAPTFCMMNAVKDDADAAIISIVEDFEEVESALTPVFGKLVNKERLGINLECLRDQFKMLLDKTNQYIETLRLDPVERAKELKKRRDLMKRLKTCEMQARKILDPPSRPAPMVLEDIPTSLRGSSPPPEVSPNRLLLPRAELVKFDGDPRQWLAFDSSFQTIDDD